MHPRDGAALRLELQVTKLGETNFNLPRTAAPDGRLIEVRYENKLLINNNKQALNK